MKSDAKLFVIPKDRAPKGPPQPPENFSVEAQCTDRLLDAARSAVAERGLKLRSISFGPKGLVVYAEENQ